MSAATSAAALTDIFLHSNDYEQCDLHLFTVAARRSQSIANINAVMLTILHLCETNVGLKPFPPVQCALQSF